MLDIFRGFVRNYNSLRLEYSNQDFTDTKYTNVVLNYFLRMGEYLGFDGIMEKDRYDLAWKKPGTTSILMHLEHENVDDLETVLEDEFKKLMKSEASIVMGIFYPSSKKEVNLWIDALREAKTWGKEILFILNPLLYGNDKTMKIHGLISDNTGFKHYEVCIPYLDEPIETLME